MKLDGVHVEAPDHRNQLMEAGRPHHPEGLWEQLAGHARHDGGTGDAVGPGDRHSLRVQAGGDPVVIVRPIHIVLDIFLAGPHHLHGAGDLLRDLDRPDDEIHLEPPAEAAAQEVVVHLHSLFRQAGQLRSRSLGEGGHLRAHPDIAAIGAHVDRAVHRLHGRMREERQLVDRFDLLSGARHGLGDVAVVARDHARLLGGRGQLPDDIGSAELRVRALVPADVERGDAQFRRPHVIADHRDGVVEADHLAHAVDRLGLGVVH